MKYGLIGFLLILAFNWSYGQPRRSNNKWGYLEPDGQGKWQVPPLYDQVIAYKSYGGAEYRPVVVKAGKYFGIYCGDSLLHPLVYDSIALGAVLSGYSPPLFELYKNNTVYLELITTDGDYITWRHVDTCERIVWLNKQVCACKKKGGWQLRDFENEYDQDRDIWVERLVQGWQQNPKHPFIIIYQDRGSRIWLPESGFFPAHYDSLEWRGAPNKKSSRLFFVSRDGSRRGLAEPYESLNYKPLWDSFVVVPQSTKDDYLFAIKINGRWGICQLQRDRQHITITDWLYPPVFTSFQLGKTELQLGFHEHFIQIPLHQLRQSMGATFLSGRTGEEGVFEEHGFYGYKNGETYIAPVFDKIRYLEGHQLLELHKNGKLALWPIAISNQGLMPVIYDEWGVLNGERGTYWLRNGTNYSCFSTKDNIILNYAFDRVEAVADTWLVGWIGKKGYAFHQDELKNITFDSLRLSDDKLCRIYNKGKTGALTPSGYWADPVFDSVAPTWDRQDLYVYVKNHLGKWQLHLFDHEAWKIGVWPPYFNSLQEILQQRDQYLRIWNSTLKIPIGGNYYRDSLNPYRLHWFNMDAAIAGDSKVAYSSLLTPFIVEQIIFHDRENRALGILIKEQADTLVWLYRNTHIRDSLFYPISGGCGVWGQFNSKSGKVIFYTRQYGFSQGFDWNELPVCYDNYMQLGYNIWQLKWQNQSSNQSFYSLLAPSFPPAFFALPIELYKAIPKGGQTYPGYYFLFRDYYGWHWMGVHGDAMRDKNNATFDSREAALRRMKQYKLVAQ